MLLAKHAVDEARGRELLKETIRIARDTIGAEHPRTQVFELGLASLDASGAKGEAEEGTEAEVGKEAEEGKEAEKERGDTAEAEKAEAVEVA